MKQVEVVQATIIKHKMVAESIYDMTIDAPEIAQNARAGQFLSVYLDDGEHLLPRPISICEIHKELGQIRMVYQVMGKGTDRLSKAGLFTKIRVMGPLGNGFAITEDKQKHLLVGGGIGVPPLLELAKQLQGEVQVFLGFRSQPILVQHFTKLGFSVNVATDDGSFGFKGNVVELIRKLNPPCDRVYSCGPKIMLKSTASFCNEHNIPCQVSMEERMACGIGACVGCAVKIKTAENAVYKKVCKDGPVFDAREVMWDD